MVQKYVLFKWRDGAQEVSAVEEESTGLLRYYVKIRVEEFGRVVIDGTGDYPNLIILDRKPRDLEKIVFAEDGKAKEYVLTPGEERREHQHIDYMFDFTTTEGGLEDLVNQVKQVLRDKGKKTEAILKMSGEQKTSELEEIRKGAKLRASAKEADALGFVEMLLAKVASD